MKTSVEKLFSRMEVLKVVAKVYSPKIIENTIAQMEDRARKDKISKL